MITIEYVKEIRKYRTVLLVANGVVLLTSLLYYQVMQAHLVESSISFYLEELEESNVKNTGYVKNRNGKSLDQRNVKILSFGNSTYVKKKLIEQFDLYPSNDENDTSLDKLNDNVNLLTKKYSIAFSGRGELVVTVQDTNLERAFNMAQAIMLLTNEMNNDYLLKLNSRGKKLCEIQLRALEGEKTGLFVKMDSLKLSYTTHITDHIELKEVMFSLDNILDQISAGKFQGKESIKHYSKLMRLHARIKKINHEVESLDDEILRFKKILRNIIVTAELLPELEPIVIESKIPSKAYSVISSYYHKPLLVVLISLGLTILPLVLRVRYKEHIRILLSKDS